jgi:hypothetical protein
VVRLWLISRLFGVVVVRESGSICRVSFGQGAVDIFLAANFLPIDGGAGLRAVQQSCERIAISPIVPCAGVEMEFFLGCKIGA